MTAKRRWRRRAVGFSLAAGAVLAVALTVFDSGRPTPGREPTEMARVERVSGSVRVTTQRGTGDGPALARQMPVYVGQAIGTGRGSGIALRLAGGLSLRVDEDTRLVLLDEHRVGLESGRVYVDTHSGMPADGGAPGTASRFEVLTERGVVRHLGTRYMVRLGAERLLVSVREGSVQVEAEGAASTSLHVPDGQELSLDETGRHTLLPSDPYGDRWQWVEALGPGFTLDGRTMAEFLEWVASETGHELVYESDAARAAAEETVLHGEVDLPAREALDLVLLTSDLAAEIRDGRIEIEVKP